tara:strand:- start:101 stop:664 length:564 start_codon:yes stop_codon:yes gene_type:complete
MKISKRQLRQIIIEAFRYSSRDFEFGSPNYEILSEVPEVWHKLLRIMGTKYSALEIAEELANSVNCNKLEQALVEADSDKNLRDPKIASIMRTAIPLCHKINEDLFYEHLQVVVKQAYKDWSKGKDKFWFEEDNLKRYEMFKEVLHDSYPELIGLYNEEVITWDPNSSDGTQYRLTIPKKKRSRKRR